MMKNGEKGGRYEVAAGDNPGLGLEGSEGACNWATWYGAVLPGLDRVPRFSPPHWALAQL